MTALRHRDDIDGLRARRDPARSPCFTPGCAALAGGFVGVDIFFVISGYLITSIVRKDMAADRFTLDRLLRRRVVRIFPALFAMLILVLAWSAVMLLPAEFERLGRERDRRPRASRPTSISGAPSDYFNPAAELMPLLHTWSLGVEEQFYIFYPLLLLLLARIWARGRTSRCCRILMLASLLLGGLVALRSPVAPSTCCPAAPGSCCWAPASRPACFRRWRAAPDARRWR